MSLFGLTSEEWSSLFSGLGISIQVTVLTLLFGLPLGVLLAVGASSRARWLSYSSIALVEIGRGVPALVLLSLVYYGLPSKGVVMSGLTSAVLALGVSAAAYTSEIFRTSLRSVSPGQREAAASLGLRANTSFWTIVLPQALRIASPQLVNFIILVFQATALCFAIAIPELLSQAYQIGTFTFEYLKALSAAALLYAVISIPMSQLAAWMEARRSARL
jgi:polar amino acid transport system permease protein